MLLNGIFYSSLIDNWEQWYESNAGDRAPSAVGKHNGTLQTPAEDDSEGYYEGSYEYYDEEDGGWENTALYNDPFCSGKKG